MMEHRCGRRIPVDIPVRLRFGDGICGVGRVFNVGWGGMFVHTSVRPRCNRCVDLRLVLPTPSGERAFLVPGMVVHAAGGGIGVMFRNLDARAAEAVAMLLGPSVAGRPAGRREAAA